MTESKRVLCLLTGMLILLSACSPQKQSQDSSASHAFGPAQDPLVPNPPSSNDSLIVSSPEKAQRRFQRFNEQGQWGRLPNVDSYFIYYGAITSSIIQQAQQYPLAILHPKDSNLSRSDVAQIQQGPTASPDDDTLVFCYVSVGEDLRTTLLSDSDIAADSRFQGDGSGPRVDPRPYPHDGNSHPLIKSEIPLTGDPSPGGTGYASYYLDDNSLVNGNADGIPDRNPVFGGLYVNMGDPQWFEDLKGMTLDSADAVAGLDEILTTSTGRGLGCDGLFLDTLDTANPNMFTNESSFIQNEFEWTAPGAIEFIESLRAEYPDKYVIQNRGLFYFIPTTAYDHYQFTTRSHIDLLMFESFRLDSNEGADYDINAFHENYFRVAPLLLAEASRPDGFQVISLGYASGPNMDANTLLGASSTGLSILQEDISAAENIGFRHFLSNPAINSPNDFVADVLKTWDADTEAPRWFTTYPTQLDGTPYGFPFPSDITEEDIQARVGIQALEALEEGLLLQWDVALDQNQITYVAYYQNTPFDFSSNNARDHVRNATRVELVPHLGAGYDEETGTNRYPFETRLPGLIAGQTYYVLIRALDSKGNEDTNTQVLSATPITQSENIPNSQCVLIDGQFEDWDVVPIAIADGVDERTGADWRTIKVANDSDALYLYLHAEYAFDLVPETGSSHVLIFFDTDFNEDTGYQPFAGFGSEWMILGDKAYRQEAGVFNAGELTNMIIATPSTESNEVEIRIDRAMLDTLLKESNTSSFRMVVVDDQSDPWDIAPSQGSFAYAMDQNDHCQGTQTLFQNQMSYELSLSSNYWGIYVNRAFTNDHYSFFQLTHQEQLLLESTWNRALHFPVESLELQLGKAEDFIAQTISLTSIQATSSQQGSCPFHQEAQVELNDASVLTLRSTTSCDGEESTSLKVDWNAYYFEHEITQDSAPGLDDRALISEGKLLGVRNRLWVDLNLVDNQQQAQGQLTLSWAPFEEETTSGQTTSHATESIRQWQRSSTFETLGEW